MRKVVLLLAALLVLTPSPRERISPTRSEPWMEVETTATIRLGDRRTRSTCGSPGRTTPTGSEARRRPNDPVHQQPPHQRRRSERVLRERRHPVGFVWGQFLDHTFGLRRAEASRRTSRSAGRPARRVHQHLGASRSPDAGRAGHRRHRPREQINTVSLHRRVQRVRRQGRPAGLAARRSGGRQPHQQRRHADAAGRLPAARRHRGDAACPRPRWR